MKKILLFAFLFSSLAGMAQSEAHNFVTYDTVYNLFYNQWSFNPWILHITRPVDADTAARPAIIFMGGAGEVGTIDKTSKNGPGYWLGNGWDGGVQLGNGKHYPIVISVQSRDQWPDTYGMRTILQWILKSYHVKKNSVHLTGLSMGAFAWSAMICDQATKGGEDGMKMVTSLACLEGQSQTVIKADSLNELPNYNSFGHWAKKYGGKFFGLEGTNDYRNVSAVSKNMNDSVPGSAYFSYETLGGGAHCCWNTMYDPAQTNWTSVGTLGPNNAKGSASNTMGTYIPGSSIFQWMLRQGDTTFVGSSPVILPPANKPPVASLALVQAITAPTAWVMLDGSASIDPDGMIDSVAFSQVSGPSQANLIYSTCGLTAGAVGLIPGTYIFKMTAWDDKGASGLALVSVVINPASPLPVTKLFSLTIGGKTTTYYSDGTNIVTQ